MRVRIARLGLSCIAAASCAVALAGVGGPVTAATSAEGAGQGTFTYSVTSAGCDGHVVATVAGALTVVSTAGTARTERGTFVLDDESWAPCPGAPSTAVSLTGPGTTCTLQGLSVAPEVLRADGEIGAGPFRIPCTIAGVATSVQVTLDGRERAGRGTTSSSGVAVVRFGVAAATGPAVP